MPAALAPAARQDVRDVTTRIARNNPTAARAFRSEIAQAGVLIGDHPEIGQRRPELVAHPFRIFPVSGFPYILVYNPERRPPLILRVLHGARDLPELLQDL